MGAILSLTLPFLFAQDAALDELLRKLADSSVEVREQALDEVVRRGDVAIPALEKAARSDDPELRVRAKEAIRRIRIGCRIRELKLDSRVPAKVIDKIEGVLERAVAVSREERIKLYKELRRAVEEDRLNPGDVAWATSLLHWGFDIYLPTMLYEDATSWAGLVSDPATRRVGRRMLRELGETLLEHWPDRLRSIARYPSPSGGLLGTGFIGPLMTKEHGPAAVAAIEEMAKLDQMGNVPTLIGIATDGRATPEMRQAAIRIVSELYRRRKVKR